MCLYIGVFSFNYLMPEYRFETLGQYDMGSSDLVLLHEELPLYLSRRRTAHIVFALNARFSTGLLSRINI